MELTPLLFALYKLAKYFLYPLTWVILLVVLTVWLVFLPQNATRLRWTRITASASLIVLLLVSNPFLSNQLIGTLEGWYPSVPPASPRPHDAIVVLSGGILDRGTLRPSDELSSYSRDRTICGVDLYQQGYAPKLLLTGGDAHVFRSGPIEALKMKEWAERLGVPRADIMTEEESRTTYENAIGTRRLLGPSSIVLVSSAFHLPRAVAIFEKQRLSGNACALRLRRQASPVRSVERARSL
ncbi:MAG TPA: YdcF family protein [Nitrospira sp.]|nr:YdcF family protein [Nitrospira sp.]